MSKWTCEKEPEIFYSEIDAAKYDQCMSEIAQILYSTYCKLQVPVENEAANANRRLLRKERKNS